MKVPPILANGMRPNSLANISQVRPVDGLFDVLAALLGVEPGEAWEGKCLYCKN